MSDLFVLAGGAVPEGSHLAAQVTGNGTWQAAAVSADRTLTPLPALDRPLCEALARFIEGALRRRADGPTILADLAAGAIKLAVLVRPAEQLVALDAVPVATPDGETRH